MRKRTRRWLGALLLPGLLLGLGAAALAEGSCVEKEEPEYISALFDRSCVHTVAVEMDPADWEALQKHALDKVQYSASATIDGERVDGVLFSAKGASSLYTVAMYTGYNERYSYRLDFNAEENGGSFHGLDRLVLNSSFYDPSCMRDDLAYLLFRRAGVPAPYTSFVELTVNGEVRGLYLAVEPEEESFFERCFGGGGAYYEPEPGALSEFYCQMIEKAKMMEPEEGLPELEVPTFAPLYETPGADLKYRGDDPSSYTDIFDNAAPGTTEEDDHAVIAALKALSEGRPEDGVDTEEVTRYFAVHNFIASWDSYSWKMLHNYGLYEKDGLLSMLPWDYNLAFSDRVPANGADGENALESVIRMDIDDPGFDGVSGKDRPMWYWIAQDGSALSAYHGVLEEDVLPYFTSGEFEKEFEACREMIRPYLEKDPTYYYSMQEFDAECDAIRDYCLRRAESVLSQIA